VTRRSFSVREARCATVRPPHRFVRFAECRMPSKEYITELKARGPKARSGDCPSQQSGKRTNCTVWQGFEARAF